MVTIKSFECNGCEYPRSCVFTFCQETPEAIPEDCPFGGEGSWKARDEEPRKESR